MKLKLEARKYSQSEIEEIIEREVERRLSSARAGRKGEFDIGGFNKGGEMPQELQAMSDHIYIASKLLRRHPRDLKMWTKFENLRAKAMDTATSGEGADWIPTGFSPAMREAIRLQLKVAALHEHIPMPTNPYVLPVEGADAQVYKQAESTADSATKVTASTPGTDYITFTAAKMMGRVLASGELEEDSVVGVINYVRTKLIKALAGGVEDCALNGDTAVTHQDSDVTEATDHRKCWTGYRRYALALGTAAVDCATFNITNLRAIRTAMGKYGANPSDLAWVVGIKAHDEMLGLDELKTVDKYGDKATILTGEVAKLDGIPVVLSEKIRENLNASGVYDGVTETKTVLHLVYRPGFLFGDRRAVKVQVLRELYAESDQIAVVGSQRLDFEPVYDTDSEPIVGIGYNIA